MIAGPVRSAGDEITIVAVAGVESVVPPNPEVLARTLNVCVPTVNVGEVNGLVHVANAAASYLHSKVAVLLAWSVSTGRTLLLGPTVPFVMNVSSPDVVETREKV